MIDTSISVLGAISIILVVIMLYENIKTKKIEERNDYLEKRNDDLQKRNEDLNDGNIKAVTINQNLNTCLNELRSVINQCLEPKNLKKQVDKYNKNQYGNDGNRGNNRNHKT